MVGRCQRPRAAYEQRPLSAFDLAPKTAKHIDVRVDLAHTECATFDVVFQPCHTEARQQWGNQHDGRAHLLGQPVVRRVKKRFLVVQVEGSGCVVHLHEAAEGAEDFEDLAHIGDVGNTQQTQRLAAKQGSAEYRQYGVLVGRWGDAAA